MKKLNISGLIRCLTLNFLDKPRLGGEKFSGQNADVGLYAKKVFGMFSGEEEIIKLECKNEMAGVIIDRFGKRHYVYTKR